MSGFLCIIRTMKKLTGLTASDGIAAGKLFYVSDKPNIYIPSYTIGEKDIPFHKERLKKAMAEAAEDLKQLINHCGENAEDRQLCKDEKDILATHIMMLSDEHFLKEVYSELEKTKKNIEFILKKKIDETAAVLSSAADEYLKERAGDIQDAFEAVFVKLLSSKGRAVSRFENAPKNSIIAAKLIKPSEAVALKNAGAAGIIMEEGGLTGHISIMARSWDIPMLVGVAGCMDFARPDMPVIVDADEGFVLLNPPPAEIKKYREKIDERKIRLKQMLEESGSNSGVVKTLDGVEVSVNANITFPEEVENKFVAASDGIGLFRSEFLFLEDGNIPDEETQFAAYVKVIKAMKNKPVVIRTFDVGADKMIGEQENLGEKNPLLGWRAVRYCLDRTEIFKTQLRALQRAAVFGNVYILVPMISTIAEIEKVKMLLSEAEKECRAKNCEYKKDVQLGIMIEVPSAAAAADLFAPYVDFMSIGTNDLIQYIMAADRENTKVSPLANYFEPAVIRLIKNTIDAERFAKQAPGHFVSMCGEMSSNPEAAFLLLGMGLRHFSMPAGKIYRMKNFFSKVSVKEAVKVYNEICSLASSDEIAKKLSAAIKEIR